MGYKDQKVIVDRQVRQVIKECPALKACLDVTEGMAYRV